MDPDANLAELLDIARQHQAELDDESRNHHADTGRMAELVLALHEHIDHGGFLPAAWRIRGGFIAPGTFDAFFGGSAAEHGAE
jgi:hypothetical protein